MRTSLVVNKAMLVGAMVVTAAPASAWEWSGYVGAATEYTDNSLQSSVDKQWDRSFVGSGGINLTQRSNDLDLSALYDIAYTTFENDTQSNETALTGSGEAHWHLVPERLTWDFAHQNSRAVSQTGEIDTTDTRTTQTVVSTGPSSRLNLTPRDSLQLSAQAMQVSTSGEVDNDSSRGTLSASVVHMTSQIQSFSLRTSQQQVEYDGDVSPDVTFTQAALEWNRAYYAGRFQLSAGQNRSKRDELPASDGDLYRLYFDYSNVGHTFSFAAAQELTDSMLGLYQPGFAEPSQQTQEPQSNFTPGGTALDVIDIIDNRHAEVNYSSVRLCDRCQPSMRVSYDNQDYQLQTLDEETVAFELGLNYAFSSRMTGGIALSRSKSDFLDVERTDNTVKSLLSLSYSLTQDFVLQTQLTRERRDSDEDLQDYTVSTALVGFQYLFGNQRP